MSGKPVWINTYEVGYLIMSNRRTGKRVVCSLDDSDIVKVKHFQWFPLWDRKMKTFYVSAGVICPDGHLSMEQVHRLVLGVTDRKKYVDHLDHNTLNNVRANLRCGDSRWNNCNKSFHKYSYPGVRYLDGSERMKRWNARISFHNQNEINVGYYQTKEEAALALWTKGKELFGDNSPYKKPVEVLC